MTYDYGGGVDLLSSALYASIKHNTNIKITEQTPCSPTGTTFIADGLDASVFEGNNLKFINNYPYSIQIKVSTEKQKCFVMIVKVK